VQNAFGRAARVAATLTPADRVGLVCRGDGGWRLVAGHNLDVAPAEVGPADTVVGEKGPRVESPLPDATPLLRAAAPEAQSCAAVPLVAPAAEVVFFVTSVRPGAFDDELLDVLTDLAAPIAEAAAEAARADARHYEFLENVPVGVYRSTPDGRILYANPSLADLFGVASVDALKDLDLNDAGIAQDDRAAFKEQVEREGQIVQNETVWTRPDGREVHVLESARVVRGADGAVQYYEGVVEDITERKRAEQELRAEKHFIDSALNSLPGAFYLIDEDLRYRRWNQQLEDVTGYASEEIVGANPLQFVVEADRERVADRIRSAFEEGQAAVEARVRTRSGGVIPLYLTAARVSIRGRRYLVGMGIDISERVAAEEALREAKQEAEEMNRLKSVFLANMSHEIRTPLTSILGFADVLEEETEGEAQRVVEMIRQSGHRLKETLTSVLELARLERESAEVDTERCDLAGRVEEILDLMTPQIESNGLALQVRVPPEPVPIQADPRVLHRVLTNLVSNAVKFTEEGTIRVTVARNEDEAHLEVSDTGIGISSEFLDQVFDEFRQESEGLTRAHQGSGLGLTITQRLVEMMGGSIEAESTKGEGSTFTVRLPLHASQEAASEAAADES
jgi:PAS domain S-box-containing protein